MLQILKNTLIVIFFGYMSIDSNAQLYSKYNLKFKAGANYNLISHYGFGDISFSLGDVSSTRKIQPGLGYQAGIQFGIRIIDGFYINSGIDFYSTSFKEEETATTNDSELSIYNTVVQKGKYSFFSFEVPIQAKISISESMAVEFGAYLSKPLSSTSKATFDTEGTLYLADGTESLEYQDLDNTQEYPDNPNSLGFGLNVAFEYYFTSNFGAALFFKKQNDFYLYEQIDIANNVIGINLLYRLYPD